MRTIIISILLAVLLGSCKDYLEPYPYGGYTSQDLPEYQEMLQGLIGQCYEYIPRNYNDNEGIYLDGASDDAVITSSTHVMKRFATANLTTGQDPFLTYWDRDYKAINLLNTFLKDRIGYNSRYLIDKHLDEILRNRLQGEAFALRAWFQWDLLQKFGGKGTNGQMLGFPIILEPISITEEINYARNTYDECVKQILMDCDSAFKYLPIAHRDFLVPESDRTFSGGRYWGRMDGITTRALKALVYLTWASPRFNPENIAARWDSAAVNAKKVMDFKLNVDNVTNGFNQVTGVNWVNPNFPGIVWAGRYLNANDAMERLFYPGGFQGYGAIGASQDLVNAFPMANGYPIDDPLNRGGYDPENPYPNRDPRFYSTIFPNASQAKRNNTGAVKYTFENWANGGKDAAGISSNNTLTNYYIKKFVFMGLNWSDASINRQPHSKYYIRWAHMCLTFAEAANQVAGPNDDTRYGISAKTAIQYLRGRKTYDGISGLSEPVPGVADEYLNEVANAGKEEFDALIRNERRVETCFEGIRFFDLRRWSTNMAELNKPVHGADIIQNEDQTFTYNLSNVVE
ncbi:MAG: RagB/SusD family nutrient uptake outer membrane protein, partial [Bacteroidales bacterium]|nr:RagB/SusD family nutrient uptake outer membrane protein [Bacteroidales bacterium]